MGNKAPGIIVGFVALVLFATWFWNREGAAEFSSRAVGAGETSEVVPAEISESGAVLADESEEATRVAADRAPVPLALVPTDRPTYRATHRILGRVVDERRMPVAGAQVALEGAAATLSQMVSAADGRFECLALLSPDEPGGRSSLVARDEHGRAAVSELHLPRARPGELVEADAGTLVLLPAQALGVRVLRAGSPAAGAVVRVALSHARITGGEYETDERGELQLEALPFGAVHLEASLEGYRGATRVFVPEEESATIELEPMGAALVLVVDAESGLGVPDAELEIREVYGVPAALPSDPQRTFENEHLSMRPWSGEAPTTDAQGRARIEGLAPGVSYTLDVRAKNHEPFPRRPASGARLEPGGELVRVELEPYLLRPVRWQVVAGEVPVPPDGATIQLRHRAGSYSRGNEPPLPASGRMQGTVLVIDEIAGNASLIGQAPDGSLARLWAGEDDEFGAETSFRRPRRIEVLVHDAARAPVAGATVQARNQGNNAVGEPAVTDAEGRAVLENLYGGLVQVHVSPPGQAGSRGTSMGSVDLELGDGQLDVTLSTPKLKRARLSIRIDGRSQLPARFRLRGRSAVHVIEELPERGELLLELAQGAGDAPVTVYLNAVGFAQASAEFDLSRDRSEPFATIELVRSTVLVARVTPPAEGYVSIMPQRFDEEQGAWEQASELRVFNGRYRANGPGGSFVFTGLSPGRWRVIDERSGVASSEALVEPGDREVTVELDLASIEWVSGRVEVPDPADPAELARVRVRVVEAGAAPVAGWRPGSEPPEGVQPRDGEFRVRVPADREVTVVAWHPWLVPAADSGRLTLRGGREGVVLKLVEGDQLRLPAPQLDPRSQALRIARYADTSEAEGQPLEWHHAVLVDGVLRCALPRGRWTLLVEPAADHAPLVLRAVEIEGVTDLPAAVFPAGSTLRVRVIAPEGSAAPRIYVHAERLGAPVYDRSINSGGEELVLVTGLGPGRYRVSMNLIMGRRSLPDQELEVDGVSDVELEMDLR